MRVYFAHPVSSYGTPDEQKIIDALARAGLEVVNPADPVHQQRAAAIRNTAPSREEASRMVMDYFFDLCATCDSCVVLPFADGSLGAGVVGEARVFLAAGQDVSLIRVEEDRIILRAIKSLDDQNCLDVAATRKVLDQCKPHRNGPRL